MGVEGARAVGIGPAPHVAEQLVAFEDPPGGLGEDPQEVELQWCQVDLAPPDGHASRAGGHREAADDEVGRGRLRRELGGPLDAPEQGLDARDDLAHAEGLGHVVVGPDREPDEDVGLVVASGEHEHGHGPDGLDAAAHLEAVEAGKHDVEEDHVGRVRGERLDGARAVEGACHGIPLGLEAQGERLVDDLVVLDDE